jgi:hypothetical protein
MEWVIGVLILVFFIITMSFHIAEINSFIKKRKGEDDGKPIENEPIMKVHCEVVSRHNDFYWVSGFECAVCAYREECKKYKKRYGKRPNGKGLFE